MHVTFLIRKLDIEGGGSNYSADLDARRLAERGHEVTVVTLDPSDNRLPPDPPYDVVEASSRPSLGPLGRPTEIARVLREHEDSTDVFHVFTAGMIPGGGLYRKLGGDAPVVGRLNNYGLFCQRKEIMDGECHRNCTTGAKFRHDDAPLPRKLAKLPIYAYQTGAVPDLLNETDQLLAVSPAVKDIYAGIGVEEEIITVLPTGFDEQFASPNGSPAPHDAFTLLYVGRLIESKGVDLLLDALQNLPDVRADVAGAGPELEALKQRASANGVRDQVTFHGWVQREDLPQLYETADLLVLPGTWPEPLGWTPTEAFQHDTPALVSDVGGAPWLVGDAGLTFRRGDPTHLADQVRTVVEDDDVYETLRNNCRSELDKVHPKRCLDRLETVYESVADGGTS